MDCFVMCEPVRGYYAKKGIISRYMDGIKHQIRKSRYKLREIDENQLDEAIKYFEETGVRPVVIVVGFSVIWLSKCLDILGPLNIHVLLLTSTREHSFFKKVSSVSFDDSEAIATLCKYFAENGIRKVAYFGYDPNVSNCSAQYDAFKKCKTMFNFRDIHPYYDCYSNYGNIDMCSQVFFSRYEDYEAVICTRPEYAVKLVHDMKARSIPPQRLLIASAGSSELSNTISPKITSYDFDPALCGQKVIKLYKTLVNNPEISFLSACITGSLCINESTKFLPAGDKPFVPAPRMKFSVQHPTYNMTGDPEVDEITRIENLLCKSDALDREYIEKIIADIDTSDFAQNHFISENTLNYRIKNMCKILGVTSKKEMYDLLTKWM